MNDSGLLVIEGLRKAYGGVVATNGVDLCIRAGEIVGLIGPNGAGKSTLFELITGFQRADAGVIRHRGKEIQARNPASIARRGVVRTFQKLRPFPDMTCLENVMVGALAQHSKARNARSVAMESLNRVGLSHRTHVRAAGLSTGQRKRLEVARALATGADLLLLDEVTGGVDPGARKQLVGLVRSLNEDGVTIALIEHNMEVMTDLAHRVVALHLGSVIAEGTASQVVGDSRVRAAYLGKDQT